MTGWRKDFCAMALELCVWEYDHSDSEGCQSLHKHFAVGGKCEGNETDVLISLKLTVEQYDQASDDC